MKDPSDMTLKELKPFMAEYIRRKRKGRTARPRVMKPCPNCGTELTATERRYKCRVCGASQVNNKI
jgi:hypothetical protein